MSGLASLATAENREAAMLRGVNVRRQATLAMLTVGCITGAVAPLVASSTYAVYSLGTSLTFYAFVALTVGGFDSRGGVLVGGLIVGLVQAEAGRYLNAEYQDIAIFILLLSALLVRPQGLFGHARERKV
jgi:branched-chain amino acid transport system permease protein